MLGIGLVRPDGEGAAPPTVLDVLDLGEIDRDRYRSRLVFVDPFPLDGGQVAEVFLGEDGVLGLVAGSRTAVGQRRRARR